MPKNGIYLPFISLPAYPTSTRLHGPVKSATTPSWVNPVPRDGRLPTDIGGTVGNMVFRNADYKNNNYTGMITSGKISRNNRYPEMPKDETPAKT